MKIGDFVQERIGGPLMRVIRLLQDCGEALCEVLSSGQLRRIATCALILVGFAIEAAHGHPMEDLPAHPTVRLNSTAALPAASGGTTFVPSEDYWWKPEVTHIPWNNAVFTDEGLVPGLFRVPVSGQVG